MNNNVTQRECLCKQPSIPEEVAFDQEKISRLQGKDVFAARSAYEMVGSDEAITLELRSATALVKKMRDTGCLEFKTWLRVSQHFTERTTLNPSQYDAATCAANDLISKLLAYLNTSLSPLAARTRTLAVKDLQEEMQKVLRVEIFWWVSEWCFGDGSSKSKRMNGAVNKAYDPRGGFALARREWIMGTLEKGVYVLFERMERVVELVVAMLWWWDRNMQKS